MREGGIDDALDMLLQISNPGFPWVMSRAIRSGPEDAVWLPWQYMDSARDHLTWLDALVSALAARLPLPAPPHAGAPPVPPPVWTLRAAAAAAANDSL